jgi:hypothetical protein
MSCIIPVAPEFQDPPAVPDSPPYLHDFAPFNIGSIVSVDGVKGQDFSAFVGDQNPDQILYFEWLFDYPPQLQNRNQYGNTGMIPARIPGQPDPKETQTVKCAFVDASSGSSSHRVELAVATERFASPTGLPADQALDSIPDSNGFVVRAFWEIDMPCMVGQ